ncbi:MAG TPA: histidine kinase, partial [Desulfobaccales bacterium]
PEDQAAASKAFMRGQENTGAYVREYRIRTKDGRVLWLQDRGQIISDPEGRVEYVSGVFFDVSESQRARMALQESEQRLRFLTSQLLTAQEQERKRISMELHDELGQSLTVLKLQVRAIERNLREDDQPELKQECRELLEYLDGVIESVRRLSRDLSPAILEDLGLLASLKYLLDGVGKHFTVRQSFEIEDLNSLFPTEAQIIIYRIFQECLNNITKHAGAREVSVAVRQDDAKVHFTLEDDGAGFDVLQVLGRDATCRGLGLAALDERARMLGGSCQVWSRLGAGTKIVVTVPVRRNINSATA